MTSRLEKNEQIIKEISDEEKKQRIKRIVKNIFKVIVIILLIFVPLYTYMRYIATKGITVNEIPLYFENLNDNDSGLKLVQFSDLNYGSTVFKEEVSELVTNINKINPDIVVFTGDLVLNNYILTNEEETFLIDSLNKIKASVGKYSVMGDRDSKYFVTIFDSTDFITLNNSYDLVYYNDNSPFIIAGLSDNAIDLKGTFSYYDDYSDIFSIVLMHRPDNVDKVLNSYKVDLVLAGHSLNGQLRIPFMGCIKREDGFKKYCDSYYEIKNTKLFISSGIGTNELRFRMFNSPSINFFRIRKET